MTIDFILGILLLIGFIRGWQKGFLWSIASVIAGIVATFISLKFSSVLANYFFEKNLLHSQYTTLICFILLFFSIILIFKLIIKSAESILKFVLLGWANKLMGGLLYIFIVSFVISTFLWLLNSSKLIEKNITTESKIFPYIEPIAPKTLKLITPHLPFFKSLYQDFYNYFEKTNNHS